MTQRQLFLQHVAQTSDAPLMLEMNRAEGIYIYDVEGRAYIDLISGINVSILGHCHPNVVKAIQEQAAKYMHLMVYGEFVYTPQVQLAKLLINQLPESLDSVYFVNSGTEAIEGALKLAKRYTGRTEMIGFKNAYHGSTHGAMSVMGGEFFLRNYRPLLPDVRHLTFNCWEGLEQISERTACVLVEPIQGEAGILLPKDGFLQYLRNRCTEVGAMLIFDEIQTGYGRTGTMFAFEQYQIVPDILVLAKGMGGGIPIGAFVASKEMMDCFTNRPVLGHITTFGGNPVCCAAGLAVLQTLLNTNLIQQVPEKERLFRELLVHPAIKEVRGKGLMLTLDFGDTETGQAVISACIKQGIITDWFLFADECLRITPPLIIEEAEIREACSLVLEAIESVMI
ncbi:MAG: aspartate aminotransferase family protein [Chitinophagales bacterium]